MAKNETLLTAPFPTHLFREQAGFAVVVWAGYSLFIFALTFVVWLWQGEILSSGWDLGVQVARWFVLAIGIYVGWTVLEMHIAHGQTRRHFFVQASTFALVYSAMTGALVTVTYGIEALIYGGMGWPQVLQGGQLFDSLAEVHLVFLQHWLVFALWFTGAMFIAAAWYRSDAMGAGALVLAIVLSGISGISISTDWGPFGWIFEQLTGLVSVPRWLAVALHIAMIALVLALTRRVTAQVALRPKAS